METTETGAVRDTEHHKGPNGFAVLYHLMLQNPDAVREWAETYGEGAIKYPPNNWQKGFKESVLINHAMEHLILHCIGDKSENHLAHAMWNIGTLIWVRAHKPELLDVTGNCNVAKLPSDQVIEDAKERGPELVRELIKRGWMAAGREHIMCTNIVDFDKMLPNEARPFFYPCENDSSLCRRCNRSLLNHRIYNSITKEWTDLGMVPDKVLDIVKSIVV